MAQVEGSLGGLGSWLDVTKGILGSQVIQRGFQMIANAINGAIDASVEYESALAGLQKTAGLSDTALENMSEQIMDLSERVPMSSANIAELADTVAHLGLSKDQILPFTEVMIALGDATDMSAEEAATSLAQLANVMHTSANDYERLGSTIFELGRTSATTESAITEMASTMAGAASLVGMSEADALGFAAALSSIGVEAASGATSVQKMASRFELLTATGSDKLQEFAEIAGMSADEFTEAWNADPAKTLAAFIDGLGNVNSSGGSAIAVLNELGVSEVRLTRNIAGLAAAGDLLDRSLNNSRRAWDENTALAEATGIAYGTTASRMEMAQNAIENAQIVIGDGLKGTKLAVKELEADAAKSLRDSIMDNSLPTQIDDINERYDATGRSLENARDQAYNLAITLDQLGNPNELGTAELEQYKATWDALREIMPAVGELYDDSTGKIMGGADALYDMIEAQYTVADSANEMQRSAEAFEAYSEKAEQLNELRKQQALALAELQDAEEDYQNLAQSSDVDPDRLAFTDEYARWQAAEDAYNAVSKAVDDCSGYLEEYAYIADDAITASNNVATALAGTSDMASDEAKAIGALQDALTFYDTEAQNLASEYAAALESARDRVDKVIGTGFEGVGDIVSRSAADTIQGLDSQIRYAEQYAEDLERAKELGASDAVLGQLADGSKTSAEILRGIVEDNGASIEELNTKYAEAQTAKDVMAASMAEATTNVKERMDEIDEAIDTMVANADQESAAYAAAEATIDGLISGIDSKLETLRLRTGEVNALTGSLGTVANGNADGSHASGLDYVPFDGYLAQLHRGEMVLTAMEAKAYRTEKATSTYARPVEVTRAPANVTAPKAASSAAPAGGQVMQAVLVMDGRVVGEVISPYVDGEIGAMVKARR